MDITNYLNNTIKFLPFIIVLCFVLYSIFATDVKSIIFLTGLLITTFITKIMLPFEGKSKQKTLSTTTKYESKKTQDKNTETDTNISNYNNNNGVEETGLINSITSKIMNSNALAAIFGVLSDSEKKPITKGGKKVVGGDGGKNCELLFLDSDEEGGKPISQIPLCLVTMWFLLSYILTIIGTENIWSENVGLVILLILISLGYTSWFRFFSDCTDNFFDGNVDYMIVIFAPIVIGGLGGFLWALYISAMDISELKYFVGITPDERCDRPRRALYKCEFK